MTILDIGIIAIPIILLAIGVFVYRVSPKNLCQELKSRTDQSEWYDENGNHIYYDRKLIRYQQQQEQKRAAENKK